MKKSVSQKKSELPVVGHIHLRVSLARKNLYVLAAKPKTLQAWILDQLDRAAISNTK